MLGKDIAFEDLLDQLNDGIFFVDSGGLVTYWNSGAERITGLLRAEVMGTPCTASFLGHLDRHGEPVYADVSPTQLCLGDGRLREEELFIVAKSGQLVPVFMRVSPICDTRGEVIGAVEVFSDNSSKFAARERIEELEELALLCPVTEVGNRRYSEIAINNAFDELQRYNWRFGLLFIDIDHFKEVNDTHGHETGDHVLRMVAHAIRDCLRSFDFVGRWGGEEFIVLLPSINDDVLGPVAERCRTSVESANLQVEGKHITVTISAGAVIANRDENLTGLIKRADQLMYRSKSAGRNMVTMDA
jgi:diguanylate cyclase (GGDEF)-like protein/PAS domain S-box-containing protein